MATVWRLQIQLWNQSRSPNQGRHVVSEPCPSLPPCLIRSTPCATLPLTARRWTSGPEAGPETAAATHRLYLIITMIPQPYALSVLQHLRSHVRDRVRRHSRNDHVDTFKQRPSRPSSHVWLQSPSHSGERSKSQAVANLDIGHHQHLLYETENTTYYDTIALVSPYSLITSA